MSDDIADLRRSVELLRADNANLRGLVGQFAAALSVLESQGAATQSLGVATQAGLTSMQKSALLKVRFSSTKKHQHIEVSECVMSKVPGAMNLHTSAVLDEPPLMHGRILRTFRLLSVANNYFMIEVTTADTTKYDVYAGHAAKNSGFSFYCHNAQLYRNGGSSQYDPKIGTVGNFLLIGVEVDATGKRARFVRNGVKGIWVPLPDSCAPMSFARVLFAVVVIAAVASAKKTSIPVFAQMHYIQGPVATVDFPPFAARIYGPGAGIPFGPSPPGAAFVGSMTCWHGVNNQTLLISGCRGNYSTCQQVSGSIPLASTASLEDARIECSVSTNMAGVVVGVDLLASENGADTYDTTRIFSPGGWITVEKSVYHNVKSTTQKVDLTKGGREAWSVVSVLNGYPDSKGTSFQFALIIGTFNVSHYLEMPTSNSKVSLVPPTGHFQGVSGGRAFGIALSAVLFCVVLGVIVLGVVYIIQKSAGASNYTAVNR